MVIPSVPYSPARRIAATCGSLFAACAALTIGAPSGAQFDGPTKFASGGLYKESGGATHSWRITPAHTLEWDSAPYLPVGTLFHAQSLDHEGPAAYNADMAALENLKSHGVRDIVLTPNQSLADADPATLQKLITYLDQNDFHYGLAFGKGISRPLVGMVIRPTVYRYYEKDGVTATWQVANTDAGLFVLVDADSGNKLVRGDYISVRNTLLTLPLEVPAAVVGRVFAQFYPHKAMVGENALPDLWGGFDDYRDRLLNTLGQVKFGKGLRFFQDPLARKLGLWGESDFTIPDSPGFRLEWEAFLTQRYGTADRIRDAWSLADGEFKTVRSLTHLAPLWEKTHGVPYFFNGDNGDKLRIVDAGRSHFWQDFLEFRDTSIEYYMNVIADILKRQAANVPVVYTWTQAHPIFVNREKGSGFDGLAIPAKGSGAALLSRALIPGFSHAEQSDRTLWCFATEINQTPVQPAAAGPRTVAITEGGQGAAAAALSIHLDTIRRVGMKGFFVGSLPTDDAADTVSAPPATELDALRDYAGRLGSEPAAARFMPRILFYPQSTPGPAHPGIVPGSSALWMGTYQIGEQLDWWPAYEGYTLNGNSVAVLVSLQGRRETHIWTTQPKLVEAFTPDGVPVPLKLVGKSEIVVNLDTTPTVFHTGGQRLVLQEAAQDIFAQLGGLYSIAQTRKLPELESMKNIVDTIQRKYAEKDYENAYIMGLGKVNELTAIVQPYIWVEGERPSRINTFDEVARNPEASGEHYLNLFNHNSPPPKYDKYGYGVYYDIEVPKEAVYTIWMSGSLPGPTVSPIFWRIDAPPDLKVAEPAPHGPTYLGDRFGWMVLGTVRLTQGQHTISIYAPERAVNPAVYSFAIDSLMITSGPFHPNGPMRPQPVSADELRIQKLQKPVKKDPPSRIPRSNYPLP